MTHPLRYKVCSAGLLLCCRYTIEQYAPEHPAEGDVIYCTATDPSHSRMIWQRGMWRWDDSYRDAFR